MKKYKHYRNCLVFVSELAVVGVAEETLPNLRIYENATTDLNAIRDCRDLHKLRY